MHQFLTTRIASGEYQFYGILLFHEVCVRSARRISATNMATKAELFAINFDFGPISNSDNMELDAAASCVGHEEYGVELRKTEIEWLQPANASIGFPPSADKILTPRMQS